MDVALLDQAEHGRAVGLSRLDRLHPETQWHDAIAVSAFWRAASFVPYLRGDKVRTSLQLDEAERLARLFEGSAAVHRLLVEQNLHPLLETRVREASAFGDLTLATSRAQEFARLDPLDGKVHIRLGDTYFATGATEDALAAYRAATVLGAPFAAPWLVQ